MAKLKNNIRINPRNGYIFCEDGTPVGEYIVEHGTFKPVEGDTVPIVILRRDDYLRLVKLYEIYRNMELIQAA